MRLVRVRPGDPALLLFLAVAAVASAQLVLLEVPVARTVTAALPALAGAAVVAAGQVSAADRVEARGRRWLRALAAGEVALALWALQAFVRALPAGIGEPSGFYRTKVLVTTPLGDHNTAAGLLLVGVVATAVLAVEDRRWWVGTAITTAGAIACLSRGAAVILLLLGAASFVVGTRRRVAVALVLAGTVALGGVLVAAVLLDASPPAGAEVPDGPLGTSVLGRFDLIRRGVEVAAEHPVLGVGLGGFGAEAQDLPPPNDHAHNALAHAAAEGGVPLAAVRVGLALLLLVRAWRAPLAWRREVALLGGVGLLAHGQIDVLGGLLGDEVSLAALLVVAGTARARPRPGSVVGPH